MEDFHVWNGVYADFEEAGGSMEVWSEALWVERSRRKVTRLLDESLTRTQAPAPNSSSEYCVPIIAAVVQSQKPFLRLMDFGGSVGLTIPAIIGALARPADVQICVIDNERICETGREVFAGDGRISFHTRPPLGAEFDIVHCGSYIQYHPRWVERARELVESGPEYLIFDDLPGGDIPTFATLQNYYGKQMPHWFFNLTEFVENVTRETGYRLFYRARYVATILGKCGPLPMANFPESHRIENAYNLAFVRPK